MELRRYQSQLSISAIGVMIIGVWTIIKGLLYTFLGQESMNYVFEGMEYAEIIRIITYIIIIILAGTDCVLRMIIGRAARAEAFEMPYRQGYLKLAIVLCTLNVLGIMLTIWSLLSDEFRVNTFFDNLASMIVDITSVYIYLQLIISAFKLRKLRKAKTEQGLKEGVACN